MGKKSNQDQVIQIQRTVPFVAAIRHTLPGLALKNLIAYRKTQLFLLHSTFYFTNNHKINKSRIKISANYA